MAVTGLNDQVHVTLEEVFVHGDVFVAVGKHKVRARAWRQGEDER